jgi:hypothetical protein
MRSCVVVALLLAGCSSFTALPYKERVTEATVVTWLTFDDVEKQCIKAGAKDPGQFGIISGCVIYNQKFCRIITGKTTTMETLGHELRHCFEGKFHQ